MGWKRMLAGTVDQELLLRNEFLVTENRVLRAQIKGRLRLSDPERMSLAEIGKRLGRVPAALGGLFGSLNTDAPQTGQRKRDSHAPRKAPSLYPARTIALPCQPSRITILSESNPTGGPPSLIFSGVKRALLPTHDPRTLAFAETLKKLTKAMLNGRVGRRR